MTFKCRNTLWLFFLSGASILIGLLLSHQLVYKLFIVPRLQDWNNIPFVWIGIVFLPILAAILYVGNLIKSVSEFLTVTFVSASITELYGYLMLMFSEPGFRQQPIYDNLFFNKRFLLTLFGYAIIMAITWGLAHVVHKRSNRGKQAAAS